MADNDGENNLSHFHAPGTLEGCGLLLYPTLIAIPTAFCAGTIYLLSHPELQRQVTETLTTCAPAALGLLTLTAITYFTSRHKP